MAIDNRPLVVPEGPPAMSSGIEVYIAECHNAFEGTCVGTDPRQFDFRGATVLVSFSLDAADRLSLWSLRHALSFAQCSSAVFGDADWPERLQERLKLVEAEFVNVVVFVGSQNDVVAETVQAAVDTLHGSFGSKLRLLVMVAAATNKLTTLTDVSGFVRGAQATNGETAQHVFVALAMLMAPKTLNCMDLEDLSPVFGSADSPAILCEAVWLRSGDGPPVFLSSEDERAVRGAKYLVMTLLAARLRLSEVRHVCNSVHEVASLASDFAYFAPVNALQSGLQQERVGWALLFCGGVHDALPIQ